MPNDVSRRLSHCELVSRFCPVVSSLPMAMISACMRTSYDLESAARATVLEEQLKSQLKACADIVAARQYVELAAEKLRPPPGERQTETDAAGRDVGRASAPK